MSLNLFSRLMPTEEAFTPLFCEQAKCIEEAARELRRMIVEDADIPQHVASIRRIETAADELARKVFLAANRTFNAPIDREDILALGHVLDDAVDLIEDTAKGIARYEVHGLPVQMHEIADAVVGSAELLSKVMPYLDSVSRDHKTIFALCEEVGRIEGRADDSFDQGLTNIRVQLRAGELDTIGYLDRKELFELVENVVDKCDDIANAVQSITAKHVLVDPLALGLPVLIGLIAIALLFDFLNGLHDAANSIATVVATRVLRPQTAVVWAAFFNFIAFLVFGLHVAQTVGVGIVSPGVVDGAVIFGALTGAIVWNLLTWWRGIPSSSSHALIGGLAGAGIAKAGLSAVVFKGLAITAAGIVLSPLIGLVLAQLLVLVVSWTNRRSTPYAVDRRFRVLQLFSASMYSLGHGGNDAQKTMGIIAVLLYSQGMLGAQFHVPFWVVITCQAAMGLGTLLGGWRIVHTMGSRITQLKPIQGFCAETGGALTLFLATALGVPVSTTHTITGAIVGVGAARRATAVRWSVAQRIVFAWVITLPAAALVAAVAYWCTRGL